MVRRPLALLILAGSIGLACEARVGPPPRPDIVFISLDTLRYDAVGPAPGRASVTPRLDELAADAVTFTEARCAIPFTLPSHMSMFTGLYPDVHGVLQKNQVLAATVSTLPEHLAALGYQTLGVVTNNWMKGRYGFDRGFDSYEKLKHDLTFAPRVRARAKELLDGAPPSDGPRFLFLHLLDPHSDFSRKGTNRLPYYVPPEWRGAVGELDEQAFCDEVGNCATDFLVAADDAGAAVSDELLAALAGLYRAGVAAMDDELGRLLDDLRRRGVYDDALIIVTSDHGEEFREHGRFIHSQAYEETVRVPLLVKLPGNRYGGRRVRGPTDSVDLLPTVLDLLRADAGLAVQGKSLLSAIESGRTRRASSLTRSKSAGGRRDALVQDGHKLILDERSGTAELYDLGADPGERNDLADERGELVERLAVRLGELRRAGAALAEHLAARPEEADAVLSEQELEDLKNIGYVR